MHIKRVYLFLLSLFIMGDSYGFIESVTLLRRRAHEIVEGKVKAYYHYIWCFGDMHIDRPTDVLQQSELLLCAKQMNAQIICEDKSDFFDIESLGLALPEERLHYGEKCPMFLTKKARELGISVHNIEFRQYMDVRSRLPICHEANIFHAIYALLFDPKTPLNKRFPGLLEKLVFCHVNFVRAMNVMEELRATKKIYTKEKLAGAFLKYCIREQHRRGEFRECFKNKSKIAKIFDKYASTLIEARILHTIRNDNYTHKHIFVVCGNNHLQKDARIEDGQEIIHYGVIAALTNDMGWEKVSELRSEDPIDIVRYCKNFIQA